MNAKQLGRMTLQALVIGTITGLACSSVQWLITGGVNPAITAGVTGAVTAALLTTLAPDDEAGADEVAETE